jgi:hypothetical protein
MIFDISARLWLFPINNQLLNQTMRVYWRKNLVFIHALASIKFECETLKILIAWYQRFKTLFCPEISLDYLEISPSADQWTKNESQLLILINIYWVFAMLYNIQLWLLSSIIPLLLWKMNISISYVACDVLFLIFCDQLCWKHQPTALLFVIYCSYWWVT